MSRILLTGTRAPVARDLALALRRQGHTVFGADVFGSALFGTTERYASPRHDAVQFNIDSARIVSCLQPDLIIPLCEEVFYWAQVDAPVFAPPLSHLMMLHSKHDFIHFAAGLGLRVPDTVRTRQWAPDCVFKPEFSRFGTRRLICPPTGPQSDDPQNPWVRQAYIAGEDLSFYAIARSGQLRAFSAYQSAWRTRGGASYYFDPVDDPRLMEIAATLARALDLTGQIACDLRRDAAGDLWLIECNPRATSGLHLLTHDPAGLASAFLADGDLVKSDGRPACLGLAMRLYGWSEAVMGGRLADWRTDMRRARDVLAGATGAAICDSTVYSLKAALAGQDLAAFLTTDIECNRRLI